MMSTDVRFKSHCEIKEEENARFLAKKLEEYTLTSRVDVVGRPIYVKKETGLEYVVIYSRVNWYSPRLGRIGLPSTEDGLHRAEKAMNALFASKGWWWAERDYIQAELKSKQRSRE